MVLDDAMQVFTADLLFQGHPFKSIYFHRRGNGRYGGWKLRLGFHPEGGESKIWNRGVPHRAREQEINQGQCLVCHCSSIADNSKSHQ